MTSGAGDGGTFRLFADWLAGANTEQCTFIHLPSCCLLLSSYISLSMFHMGNLPVSVYRHTLIYTHTSRLATREREQQQKDWE